MKVYLVYCGEYEEKEVFSVYLNEEFAKKEVEYNNSEDIPWSYEEYEIDEEPPTEPKFYHYTVRLFNKTFSTEVCFDYASNEPDETELLTEDDCFCVKLSITEKSENKALLEAKKVLKKMFCNLRSKLCNIK